MTPTQTLATEVAEYIDSIGGRARSRRGVRRQSFEVPCGPPHERNYRYPFLRVDVTVRPVRCEVVVDRWNCQDAPESSRAWMEQHIWPAVHAAASRSRRGAWLPAGGSYDGAVVLPDDLMPVLRAWLPQELDWQSEVAEVSKP